jgi:hypothetical protein
MAIVAERDLHLAPDPEKVEAGDTNVSIGNYAGVLQALGLLEGLSQITNISNDSVGQVLASADLPKHIHLKQPAGSSRDG